MVSVISDHYFVGHIYIYTFFTTKSYLYNSYSYNNNEMVIQESPDIVFRFYDVVYLTISVPDEGNTLHWSVHGLNRFMVLKCRVKFPQTFDTPFSTGNT